ncbi:MAG: D-glycero-beta-D-manno-heptose-7-phosphate kinase [Elusimicrobiota bacterium]
MPKSASKTLRLRTLLDRFPGKRILVLGDLMLDQFIRGSVARISPEAPVPVVAVRQETHAPGGAGNVSSNLTALGAQVSLFSVVGSDLAGARLLDDLRERGANTDGVLQLDSRVTTQKCRVVAEHQQIVRFDRETLSSLPRSAQDEMLKRLRSALATAHALIISDYGKGIVTEHVVRRALSAAHRTRRPVLVDPKVEHFKRYRGVDCMTPNIHEAWAGMRLQPVENEEDIARLGKRILRSLRLRSVLITRGEKGMTLFRARTKRRITHIPTVAKEVFDVTGAGDTVISLMALALASGSSMHEAALLANVGAGIVVGKLGTATVSIAEIRRGLTELARRMRR